jgi:hypothetical protein
MAQPESAHADGRRAALLSWLGILLIIALGALLRFWALRDNPGWYSDEGTHLAIAKSLIAGEPGYLAVAGSTLLFAKLPLYDWLLASAGTLWPPSMLLLRSLSASLGLLAVLLLFAASRGLTSKPTWALLPAFVLAVMPPAVLYQRMGFSYHLLASLLIIIWYGLAAFERDGRRRHLALAGVAMGIGGISDIWIWSLLPLFLYVVLKRAPRALWWAFPLALSPFLVYGVWMWVADSSAFLFDLRYTMTRLGGADVGAQMRTLSQNLTVLLFQDVWFVVGLIGLWRLRVARGLTLAFLLLPIIILGRTVALYHLSGYYLIPLFPFMALGAAQLGADAAAYLGGWAGERLGRPLALRYAGVAILVGLFLLLPAGLAVRADWRQATSGWQTALDPFLVPGAPARAAAAYVNARVGPEDLTLASPAVAWLIDGRAADYQMAAAATGLATPHLPSDMPETRWRFDPRTENALFVIVDDLWRRWAAAHVPGVAELLAQLGDWQLRLDSDGVQVYERRSRR